MKLKQSVTKPIEEIVDIFCNKCGMSCKGHIGNFNGLIEAKVTGAFDSTHLGDGDVYCFSLCEKCVLELIESFKLNSKAGNYLFPAENPPDFDRHEYFSKDTVLWEDLPEDQKKELLTGIKDGMGDFVSHLSREELIVFLYDLENDTTASFKDPDKYIEKIKKILEEKL